ASPPTRSLVPSLRCGIASIANRTTVDRIRDGSSSTAIADAADPRRRRRRARVARTHPPEHSPPARRAPLGHGPGGALLHPKLDCSPRNTSDRPDLDLSQPPTHPSTTVEPSSARPITPPLANSDRRTTDGSPRPWTGVPRTDPPSTDRSSVRPDRPEGQIPRRRLIRLSRIAQPFGGPPQWPHVRRNPWKVI